MTRWHGRMGRGAGRAIKLEKRQEAQERDAVSIYNAEIGRVAREHNVSPRAARRVVNAERRLEARKQQHRAARAAGYQAYVLAEPTPPRASLAWRQGWERALSDERGETVPE